MNLTFDEDTHTYRLDGVPVPSVTQILHRAGLIDDTWFTRYSAERGSRVHLALRYLDEDRLRDETVSPYEQGFVDAYKRFLADTDFVPALIEKRVAHEVYRYAGTLDRTGSLGGPFGGAMCLIDIKTGHAQPWAALQTAAYAACLPKGAKYRRFALELRGDGTYRLIEHRDWGRDFRVFLAALEIAAWKGEQER